jgi:hypothetical protein
MVKRGAVWADYVVISTHVEEYVWVILWGACANAHKFFSADFNGVNAIGVVKVGYDFTGHFFAKLHGTKICRRH